MPRELPIGNGSMLVNFDSSYCLRDFYFPRVGRDNNSAGHRFRVGIWAEGEFSWLHEDGWTRRLGYVPDTLVTSVELENLQLGLRLNFHDTVAHDLNLLLRVLTVDNLSTADRRMRIFFTQDFHIAEIGWGNTAYYEPVNDFVVHYRGRRYFVVNGRSENGNGIQQYSMGVKELPDKEGTWRDCEDGELSGNPIAHGSVDSAIALEQLIPGNGRSRFTYWIAAERGYFEARDLDRRVCEEGAEIFVNSTRLHWQQWADSHPPEYGDLSDRLQALYRRSLLVIRTQIDNGGAILAANDGDSAQFNRDTYSYMWPRCGALVANALDLAGHHDLTAAFFEFCGGLMPKGGYYQEGYLLHKYNPDGSLGSSWHPWIRNGKPKLPIQEDETALVIWALWRHHRLSGDPAGIEHLYQILVKPAAKFMLSYRHAATGLPLESYDLWEERYGILTFTTATVVAALYAASDLARTFGDSEMETLAASGASEIKHAMLNHLYRPELGRFCRMLELGDDDSQTIDPTIDASLAILFVLGILPAESLEVTSTMRAIEQRLWVKTDVGGVARYENDPYLRRSDDLERIPGNPWFVTTLWLVQWWIATAKTPADLERAHQTLEWVADLATPSGLLSEQLDPLTGEQISASPLTWSHAAFIETVIAYGRRWRDLESAESQESISAKLRAELSNRSAVKPRI